MAKAVWNGKTLAESDKVEKDAGHVYFPPDSLKKEHFQESHTQTEDPRKGTATYFHLKVDGQVNVDAAWAYLKPKTAAKHLKGHMAFWRGVEITE